MTESPLWPRPHIPRISWLLGLLLSGCVSVYQPLVSLQRPVVLDPELANFEGLKLLVRCHQSDYLDYLDAQRLCGKVRTMFANQGAGVEVDVVRRSGAGSAAVAEEPSSPAAKPDLILELKSRLVHSENSKLLWGICFISFTLVPAITEYTFSQEVAIRDPEGFLLASDELQGRFVRYFGAGTWVVNKTLDWLVRAEPDKLTGSAVNQDFSKDFYGQLSQLAFHARMRSLVLHSFENEVKAAAAPGPASPAPASPPK